MPAPAPTRWPWSARLARNVKVGQIAAPDVDDRVERGVVEEAGVEDQVDAGLGREAGRLGVAAVGHGRHVEGVGGVGDRPQLVERPHLSSPCVVGERAGDVDLDPVGAVLDLLAGGR